MRYSAGFPVLTFPDGFPQEEVEFLQPLVERRGALQPKQARHV